MGIQIIEVENKKQLNKFTGFARWLYCRNAFYTGSLKWEEKLRFSPKCIDLDKCLCKQFLAKDGGKVVGRIAVVVCDDGGKLCAKFTRFDFVDNRSVSEMLFHAAVTYARRMGCVTIRGPIGFDGDDEKGLRIGKFDVKEEGTIYNYAYYMDHFVALGLEEDEDISQILRTYVKQVG